MICPVVSKEHFRSMRITLAFSVIALSFCIAFAVLTFAGILAQYTALCAAFFALVSSGLFLLYRFSRDISLRKLELTESEIRVFGKTGKLLKTFPYSAVRELRVVTLMVGNFGGMYGKLKPENFICLSLDGQIPAPETRLTELYGSLDCLTFAYTKEAMDFINKKFPPAVLFKLSLQSPVLKKRTAAILFEKSERSDSYNKKRFPPEHAVFIRQLAATAV